MPQLNMRLQKSYKFECFRALTEKLLQIKVFLLIPEKLQLRLKIVSSSK